MSRPRDPLLAGRTERIDTRVLPETRASLQTAATANRVSLSREIEARLVESLEVDAHRLPDVGLEQVQEKVARLIAPHLPWDSNEPFDHGERHVRAVRRMLSALERAASIIEYAIADGLIAEGTLSEEAA